jgi:hypothetical protein
MSWRAGCWLAAAWGQPVVVENRPSASNQLGADYVANLRPTATLSKRRRLRGEALSCIKAAVRSGQGFPAGRRSRRHPSAVAPSVPIHSVRDLIALAKQKPGELNYGTYGIGSPAHVNMAVLENISGVKLTPVHYRGGGPALTDLIGGHIHMLLINVGLMTQPWQASQLRPIEIGSGQAAAVPQLDSRRRCRASTRFRFGIFCHPARHPDRHEGQRRRAAHRRRPFVPRTVPDRFCRPATGRQAIRHALPRGRGKFSKVIKDLHQDRLTAVIAARCQRRQSTVRLVARRWNSVASLERMLLPPVRDPDHRRKASGLGSSILNGRRR